MLYIWIACSIVALYLEYRYGGRGARKRFVWPALSAFMGPLTLLLLWNYVSIRKEIASYDTDTVEVDLG